MTSLDKGGPAFPVTIENDSDEAFSVYGQELPPRTSAQFHGMSLREYIAAHAPVSFDNALEACRLFDEGDLSTGNVLKVLAEMRTVYADAQLARLAEDA